MQFKKFLTMVHWFLGAIVRTLWTPNFLDQDLHLINCHTLIRDLEPFLPVPFCDQTWIAQSLFRDKNDLQNPA